MIIEHHSVDSDYYHEADNFDKTYSDSSPVPPSKDESSSSTCNATSESTDNENTSDWCEHDYSSSDVKFSDD